MHSVIVSVSLYIYNKPCSIWKTLFPWSHPSLLSLTTSYYCFFFPEPCQEPNRDIPLRVEYSNVSHSLYIVHLQFSMLIAIYCKKLLWLGLSDILVYGHRSLSLSVILLLWSFSRIIAVDFPLGSIESSILGYFSSVSFYLMDWANLKNVVGNSHNSLSLLYQVSCRKLAIVGFRVHSWVILMITFLLW